MHLGNEVESVKAAEHGKQVQWDKQKDYPNVGFR